MSDIPDMPVDFWPDEVLVVAKYNGAELAYVISADTFFQDRATAELMPSLNGLRRAMWQNYHVPLEGVK